MSQPPESEWRSFSDEQLELLRHTLLDVVRELSRRVPAPRGLPFFGLDHPAGNFSPYERLAAHGIFRKYESVVMLGAGLGAAARWCHAHFGCDVTGVDTAPAVAMAQALSARAGLSKSTRFLAASPWALALRTRFFTHAWAVESLREVTEGDARLRELFRVVRLGGLLGVQQSAASPTWVEHAAGALASVGFVEIEVAPTTRPPLAEGARRARERLVQALRQSRDPLGPSTAVALEQTYSAWPAEGGEVVQILARRP